LAQGSEPQLSSWQAMAASTNGRKSIRKSIDESATDSTSGVVSVNMRTVKSDDGGATLVGNEDSPSQTKIQFLKFTMKELRADGDGFKSVSMVNLNKLDSVSQLALQIGDQSFPVSTGGKLLQVVLGESITLPVEALLSMQYTSSGPGRRVKSVHEHPLLLEYGQTGSGGGCCAVQ